MTASPVLAQVRHSDERPDHRRIDDRGDRCLCVLGREAARQSQNRLGAVRLALWRVAVLALVAACDTVHHYLLRAHDGTSQDRITRRPGAGGQYTSRALNQQLPRGWQWDWAPGAGGGGMNVSLVAYKQQTSHQQQF